MSPISAASSSLPHYVASKSAPPPPPPAKTDADGDHDGSKLVESKAAEAKSATIGVSLGADVASGKVAGTTISRAPLISGQLLNIQA